MTTKQEFSLPTRIIGHTIIVVGTLAILAIPVFLEAWIMGRL